MTATVVNGYEDSLAKPSNYRYPTNLLNDRRSDNAPDLLTIEEAAQVLRIGRTAAYLLAQRDLANGGSEGLHVVRVGRLLRVPRTALESLVGGPISLRPVDPPTAAQASRPPASTDVDVPACDPSRSSRPRRATRPAPDDQLTIPFAS
jgi:hypothetical protein